MSKINAVRLINLNYNNNSIRISDETFRFNGESTLLSLRNGGGKSVLVQMIMAPFVHRRYQNAKDRPFASYFTTNKPTFILVEWKLDQGAGYVLTGMMVRRSQEIDENHQDELEVVNFISEYRVHCQQDLDHLPVVEKTKKDVTLKGFAVCKQLFETWKRERHVPFFYYDMNNASQSRQYFSKLAEYQIHYKEWEGIIKKVNLKESGLSDLFADCRDEKGLVEKWFLEAVENKLNQDRNRMKEFQDIMEKYTGQYKDNQSKIQRRDTIRAFGQEAEQVRETAVRYRDVADQLEGQKGRIADFIYRLHELEGIERAKEQAVSLQMEELAGQINELEYEKLSGEYYEIADRESHSVSNLEMLRIEEEDLDRKKEEILYKLHVLACGKQQENLEECRQEREQELQRLSLCRERQENLEPERMRLGWQLKQYYGELQAHRGEEKEACSRSLMRLEQGKQDAQRKLEELRESESALIQRCGALDAQTKMFDGIEERFNQEYMAQGHFGKGNRSGEEGLSGKGVRSMEKGFSAKGGRSMEEGFSAEGGRSTEEGLSGEEGHVMEGGYFSEDSRFREGWSRNILGEYEPGALQIAQAEYEKQLNADERAKTDAKVEAEQYKEQVKSLRRLVEDKVSEREKLESARRESKARLLDYEQELSERGVILRYFGLGQEDAFDTEKILAAAQRKLLDTDLVRQGLEKEADALEKEYRKMAQGQVLELSEEFRGLLEEAGIHFVYGMEWLRKNQFSAQRNQRIVAEQPFLPYSLIMSGEELERLAGLGEQVFTSSPVPILRREELEQPGGSGEGTIQSFGKVHFYVWFNDNLLDGEKLKSMLAEQEMRIRKLRKNIDTKKAEYTEYISHQEKIRGQKVSKAAFEAVKEEIAALEREFAALEQEILSKREELAALESRREEKEQQAAQLEKAVLYQSRRLADFKRFCQSYEEYRENCRQLEKARKERERVLNLQKLEQGKITKLEQNLVTERNRLTALERELESCAEKCLKYQQYQRPPVGETGTGEQDSEKDGGQENMFGEASEGKRPGEVPEGKHSREALEGKHSGEVSEGKHPGEALEEIAAEKPISETQAKEAEIRYEVITSGIGAEQRELEQRVEKAQRRYAKALEELRTLAEKYHLEKEEWLRIRYDKKEETHQEILLEEQDKKLDRQNRLIQDEEIQCALRKQEKQGKLSQIKERCGKESPVARENIKTIRFEDAIRKLEYEKEETAKEEKRIQKKLQGYEGNLTALAEYEDFVRGEAVEWEVDFAAMDGRELTKQKGILVRDYNAYTEQRREARSALERVLNRMSRMEAFAEDFYQKPLDAMLQLTEDAGRVLRQLETTVASYNSLMEKLQVDISLVEKEKAKIVELVGDYLKEVHDNLNKIDRNSTITVRERPVKMLKMELPDWTENENLYQLRLQDYIDDVTARGIALLEENQNLQEYLGTRMTTKGLYDGVVGIGNVQIRLYKIEAQREYPITWADVAKNSGGEGFLSAFVILSALLYYMRKDDSDIFADRNEGKVLLMDNPFAQTNASHLLKPLMDMAKKSNTQLICLSGLGGESIYNRFDNIYVLTLISANLRNDMQYLKAEHMRGSEDETVLVSQIEVMEQQEFVF